MMPTHSLANPWLVPCLTPSLTERLHPRPFSQTSHSEGSHTAAPATLMLSALLEWSRTLSSAQQSFPSGLGRHCFKKALSLGASLHS